jgi:Zn-dependent peptidase ImmA (M78 family)
MTFDYQVLGRKLRNARESLTFSLQDSASYLQISLQEYLDIEEGKQKITGDQLVLLTTLYRRDFRYFVTGDYPSAESQIQEMFRRNAALSQKDRIAIQEFVRLCEYEEFLEREIFHHQPFMIPDYSQNSSKYPYFKEQGKEAASWERSRLALEEQPINNIFELLRNQGIHVFKRRLEDRNISGLYINHPLAGHCILVNYLEDIYRQNFSAAHEYCHALFDSVQGQDITYLKSVDSNSKFEWRANSFARNFLVPKLAIEKHYLPAENYESWISLIRQMAEHFRVNSQVVVIQLYEFNWIEKELKDKLLNDNLLVIKARDKFDPEIPSDLSLGLQDKLTKIIQNGLSWHFIELCTEAYRQKEIT